MVYSRCIFIYAIQILQIRKFFIFCSSHLDLSAWNLWNQKVSSGRFPRPDLLNQTFECSETSPVWFIFAVFSFTLPNSFRFENFLFFVPATWTCPRGIFGTRKSVQAGSLDQIF